MTAGERRHQTNLLSCALARIEHDQRIAWAALMRLLEEGTFVPRRPGREWAGVGPILREWDQFFDGLKANRDELQDDGY
jgi:hypothetical protein